jgi:hypothetical protein
MVAGLRAFLRKIGAGAATSAKRHLHRSPDLWRNRRGFMPDAGPAPGARITEEVPHDGRQSLSVRNEAHVAPLTL